MNTIFSFLKNPMVRAVLLKWLRHGLTTGGGALTAYLVAHGADGSQATQLAGELTGAVMTAAGIGLSMWDAHTVDQKINAAIALAPNTPQATVDALKAGKF